MHYEIKYKGPQADDDAIQGMIEWLGQKRFDDVTASLKEATDAGECNARGLCLLFSLAGIQGYPVDAWIRKYAPQLVKES